MKYELVILGSGQGSVLPFSKFADVWEFYIRHPGEYNFLVNGKPANIRDYAFDNMLIPAYRFK